MTCSDSMLARCICGDPTCDIPFGLCHCGCGARTAISKQNCLRYGWIMGMPKFYVFGHRRIRPKIEDAVPFKIDGDLCRVIPLTQGLVAIVDVFEYERLMQWKWHAFHPVDRYTYYAQRQEKCRMIRMHSVILPLTDGRTPDHKNGNGLDNRHSNLRPGTRGEQILNGRMRRNNTSGHRHVSNFKGRWVVTMRVDGNPKWFGSYISYEEACQVADEMSAKYHGEFRRKP